MVSFIELNNESCQVIVDISFLWFAYYGLICFTLQCCHYFKKNINELQIFKGEESDSEEEEEQESEQPIINEEPEIIEETDSDYQSEKEQPEFIEVNDSEEEEESESGSEDIDPNYTYPFLKNYSLRKRRRMTG
jgi:hypothetical protein